MKHKIVHNFSQKKPLLRTGLALAILALSAAAHAAGPASLWVDITNDRASAVQTLLAQGTDPNVTSAGGEPAIMQAIRDGAWNVYEVLAADPKTRINAVNARQETPLMYLALVGQTKRAEALIARGAQVNRLGWTPLHYAASKGHLDTVRMLIQHKAIVDAPAPDGTTPLMMAAFSGSQPVVQALLDAGAEVTTQTLDHHDAANWARLAKHDELADKLDAMIQQTQRQRAAQHAKNLSNDSSAPSAGHGAMPAAGQGGQPANPAPGGEAAQSGSAAGTEDAEGSKAQGGASEGNSTSRYFSPADVDPHASH